MRIGATQTLVFVWIFSNFNLAYDLLNHLHGGHLIKPERGFTTPLIGQMIVFDQEAFMYPPPLLTVGSSASARWLANSISLYNPNDWDWTTSGLFNWTLPTVTVPVHDKATATHRTSFSFDHTGFVYFPLACATGQECSIHVALHGCKQGQISYIYIFLFSVCLKCSFLSLSLSYRQSLCGRCVREKSWLFRGS